jgi:hypothetical protein
MQKLKSNLVANSQKITKLECIKVRPLYIMILQVWNYWAKKCFLVRTHTWLVNKEIERNQSTLSLGVAHTRPISGQLKLFELPSKKRLYGLCCTMTMTKSLKSNIWQDFDKKLSYLLINGFFKANTLYRSFCLHLSAF